MSEIVTKICSMCGVEKSVDMFGTHKSRKDGLNIYCKDCSKENFKKYYQENSKKIKGKTKQYKKENSEKIVEKNKQYRQENSEKILIYSKQYYQENSEYYSEYQKQYRQENRESIKEKGKKYYQENSESIKEKGKKYYQENSEKVNAYYNKRRQVDINFRLRKNMSSRVHTLIKQCNSTIKKDTMKFTDCTLLQLKSHIEKQFVEGMNWDNYGKWHVDHYIPCSYFDFTLQEDINICCNFRNLRPMWGNENISKSDTLPEDYLEHLAMIQEAISTVETPFQ